MTELLGQENTSCLNRESSIVQSHNGLRRNRKALLSDLSSLVKSAKRLAEADNNSVTNRAAASDMDDIIMKTFKLVSRGVKFLDIWIEDIYLDQSIDIPVARHAGHLQNGHVPPTPPAEIVAFDNAKPCSSASVSDGSTYHNVRDHQEQTSSRPHYSRTSQTYIRPGLSQSCAQALKPVSTYSMSEVNSHQPRCRARPSVSHNSDLASEKLSASHDAFLGFLGCFIGLHLQSRSSSELLVTTQASVNSCRGLLRVAEEVWERDLRRSELLDKARDNMYGQIENLVEAARDVFRPPRGSDGDDVFEPTEGKRLVEAATACVRGAGECVSQTRFVIDRIGDFEFEPLGLGIFSFDNADFSSQNGTFHDKQHTETSVPPEPSSKPPPPPPPSEATERRSVSSIIVDSPSSLALKDAIGSSNTVSSQSGGLMLPPIPHFGTSLMLREDYSTSSQSSSGSQDNAQQTPSLRIDSFDISSTGGSMRDSETSLVSQTSTRATSPEVPASHLAISSLSDSFTGSQSTYNEECEEAEVKILEKTFAHELVYNKDGQITGGTLPALIERLTTHDSTPDAMFVSTFFLTFRLFATPREFAEALINRFHYIGESPHIANPVRLRVYNVFKGWLESHWRNDCDMSSVELILDFAINHLSSVLPSAGSRLRGLAEKITTVSGPLVPRLISAIGKTNTSIAPYVPIDTPLPAPIMSKSQYAALKSWKNGGSSISILDFDPLELARQFTIKESRIFCSILPEELLATEWMKKSGSMAVNVRAMSTLSTDLANLVADCILQIEDPKKRAMVIKRWVKIAKRCLELNNYDSLMAIICALNSSTILRLKHTWDIVSSKTKTTLEHLKSVVDCSRNYASLRQRLQHSVPPCLPFVGTYLTDLTFVDVGNQTTRQIPGDSVDRPMSVINFDKHMKTARIISELQRFQIPYRLTEVSELQTWIQDQLVRVRSSDQSNVQNYYRRSLLLEPREQTAAKSSSPEAQNTNFSLQDLQDKFEHFGLAWTHLSKERSNTPV